MSFMHGKLKRIFLYYSRCRCFTSIPFATIILYINLMFACQEQNCCRLFVSRSIFNLVFSFSIVILDNAVHYRRRSIDNNKLTNRFDSVSQEIFPFVHSIIIHQISSPISLITFLWHVFIL